MRRLLLLVAIALTGCTQGIEHPLREPVRLYVVQPLPTGDSTGISLHTNQTLHIRALPDLVISGMTSMTFSDEVGWTHGTGGYFNVTNRILGFALTGETSDKFRKMGRQVQGRSVAVFWGQELLSTNIEAMEMVGEQRLRVVLEPDHIEAAKVHFDRQTHPAP